MNNNSGKNNNKIEKKNIYNIVWANKKIKCTIKSILIEIKNEIKNINFKEQKISKEKIKEKIKEIIENNLQRHEEDIKNILEEKKIIEYYKTYLFRIHVAWHSIFILLPFFSLVFSLGELGFIFMIIQAPDIKQAWDYIYKNWFFISLF